MWLLEIINKHVNYKNRGMKISFTILCCACFIVHFLNFLMKSRIEIPQFLVQIILLIIIYLSLYIAPKTCLRTDALEIAFDIEDYKIIYDKYRNYWMYIKRGEHKKKKLTFIIGWCIIVVICCVLSIIIGIITLNLCGAITVGLYVLAMFLNCFSYFTCFLYVMFLRKISNSKEIKNYKHNKFLPATSSGFQKLVSNAQQNSMVFLIVAVLFSILYCILLTAQQINSHGSLIIKYPYIVFFLTLQVILLGVGTFCIDYIAPQIFLGRILGRWKEQTLAELESDLYDESIERYSEREEKIIVYIENLNNNRIKYRYRIVDYILIITTIIANLVSVLSFLLPHF